MHFRLRSALLLLPLCALLACGSSGSSANISAAPTLQTGGYILTISPNLAGATQLPGAISAGVGTNTVNAVFIYTNVQSAACGQQDALVPVAPDGELHAEAEGNPSHARLPL